MVLDVPLMVCDYIGDPAVPLFFTEGIKKIDAIVSLGMSGIGLLGVWNWRGTNDKGGKTVLAAFESIALNGREVYIVFDSDVMTKPEVYLALSRFKGFLESRKAKVKLIYLPHAEGGAKQGVDDYLVRGQGTLDDLMAGATSELRSLPKKETDDDCPYKMTTAGIVWEMPVKDGIVPVRLTNFKAEITTDVYYDDGAESWHSWEITTELKGRSSTFDVHASQFASMDWVPEKLGARAILNVGSSIKDRTRHAIQVLSKNITEHTVYIHIGWRKFDDEWFYLHAEGAIGQKVTLARVDKYSAIHPRLASYVLRAPPTGEARCLAISASLRFLDVAPRRITVPLFAATYRACLKEGTESLYGVGATGIQKTAVAVLCQQHYGSDFGERSLPGNWASTDNATEHLTFLAKDALFVLDDFVKPSNRAEADRMNKMADRIMRGIAGNGGRDRLRPDGTPRPPKPPRTMPFVTGEELPTGQSLLARTVIVQFERGDVDKGKLTACQEDGRHGLYAQAMSGFIRWLAPHRQAVLDKWNGRYAALRDSLASLAPHARTAPNIASLAMGLELFIWYAIDAQALTHDDAIRMWVDAYKELVQTAHRQAVHDREANPVHTYLQCLRERLAIGQSYLKKPGVRHEHDGTSTQIGWLDEGKGIAYLYTEVAMTEARKTGSITIDTHTMTRRIKNAGLVALTEPKSDRILVRETFEGKRDRFLAIKREAISLVHADDTQETGAESENWTGAIPPLDRWWTGDFCLPVHYNGLNDMEIEGFGPIGPENSQNIDLKIDAGGACVPKKKNTHPVESVANEKQPDQSDQSDQSNNINTYIPILDSLSLENSGPVSKQDRSSRTSGPVQSLTQPPSTKPDDDVDLPVGRPSYATPARSESAPSQPACAGCGRRAELSNGLCTACVRRKTRLDKK